MPHFKELYSFILRKVKGAKKSGITMHAIRMGGSYRKEAPEKLHKYL